MGHRKAEVTISLIGRDEVGRVAVVAFLCGQSIFFLGQGLEVVPVLLVVRTSDDDFRRTVVVIVHATGVAEVEVFEILTCAEVNSQIVGILTGYAPSGVEEGVDVAVKQVGDGAFAGLLGICPDVAGSSLVSDLESNLTIGLILGIVNGIFEKHTLGVVDDLPEAVFVDVVLNVHNGVVGVGSQITFELVLAVAGNRGSLDDIDHSVGVLHTRSGLEVEASLCLSGDVYIEATAVVPTELVVRIVAGDNLVKAIFLLCELEAEASLCASSLRAPSIALGKEVLGSGVEETSDEVANLSASPSRVDGVGVSLQSDSGDHDGISRSIGAGDDGSSRTDSSVRNDDLGLVAFEILLIFEAVAEYEVQTTGGAVCREYQHVALGENLVEGNQSMAGICRSGEVVQVLSLAVEGEAVLSKFVAFAVDIGEVSAHSRISGKPQELGGAVCLQRSVGGHRRALELELAVLQKASVTNSRHGEAVILVAFLSRSDGEVERGEVHSLHGLVVLNLGDDGPVLQVVGTFDGPILGVTARAVLGVVSGGDGVAGQIEGHGGLDDDPARNCVGAELGVDVVVAHVVETFVTKTGATVDSLKGQGAFLSTLQVKFAVLHVSARILRSLNGETEIGERLDGLELEVERGEVHIL